MINNDYNYQSFFSFLNILNIRFFFLSLKVYMVLPLPTSVNVFIRTPNPVLSDLQLLGIILIKSMGDWSVSVTAPNLWNWLINNCKVSLDLQKHHINQTYHYSIFLHFFSVTEQKIKPRFLESIHWCASEFSCCASWELPTFQSHWSIKHIALGYETSFFVRPLMMF